MSPPASAAHRHVVEPPRAQAAAARRLDSASLFAGHRELVIEHAGCEYRLRRTRTGKLILTK